MNEAQGNSPVAAVAEQTTPSQEATAALTEDQRADLEKRLAETDEAIKAQNEADAAKLGKLASRAPELYQDERTGAIVTKKEYEHDTLGKAA